jgi:hypothetical protein
MIFAMRVTTSTALQPWSTRACGSRPKNAARSRAWSALLHLQDLRGRRCGRTHVHRHGVRRGRDVPVRLTSRPAARSPDCRHRPGRASYPGRRGARNRNDRAEPEACVLGHCAVAGTAARPAAPARVAILVPPRRGHVSRRRARREAAAGTAACWVDNPQPAEQARGRAMVAAAASDFRSLDGHLRESGGTVPAAVDEGIGLCHVLPRKVENGATMRNGQRFGETKCRRKGRLAMVRTPNRPEQRRQPFTSQERRSEARW